MVSGQRDNEALGLTGNSSGGTSWVLAGYLRRAGKWRADQSVDFWACSKIMRTSPANTRPKPIRWTQRNDSSSSR